MSKSTSPIGASFNYETHVKELNERFARLVKQLGPNNKKGTVRYKYEVEFSHALNEIATCPKYLQGKMFDQASGVVNNLINAIKVQQEPAAEAA